MTDYEDTTAADTVLIDKLAAGHIGASSALERLRGERPEFFGRLIFDLQDMQMSGEQIWQAYLFCNNDVDLLAQRIAARSEDMVRHVNQRVTDRQARRFDEVSQTPEIDTGVRQAMEQAQHDGRLRRADEGAEVVHQFFVNQLLGMATKVQAGERPETNFLCNVSHLELGEGKYGAVFHITFVEFLDKEHHDARVKEMLERAADRHLPTPAVGEPIALEHDEPG